MKSFYVIIALVLFTLSASLAGLFLWKQPAVKKDTKVATFNHQKQVEQSLSQIEKKVVSILTKHLKKDKKSPSLMLKDMKTQLDKDLTVLNKNQKSIYNHVLEIEKQIKDCDCCKKQVKVEKKTKPIKKQVVKTKRKKRKVDLAMVCYSEYLKYVKKCNSYNKEHPKYYKRTETPQMTEVIIEQVSKKLICKSKYRYIQECLN